MSRKEYFAYGSNLNFDQMAYRCPEATVVAVPNQNRQSLNGKNLYRQILHN